MFLWAIIGNHSVSTDFISYWHCYTENVILSYYLLMAGGSWDGFMLFSRVLAQTEMQTGFELWLPIPFAMTITITQSMHPDSFSGAMSGGVSCTSEIASSVERKIRYQELSSRNRLFLMLYRRRKVFFLKKEKKSDIKSKLSVHYWSRSSKIHVITVIFNYQPCKQFCLAAVTNKVTNDYFFMCQHVFVFINEFLVLLAFVFLLWFKIQFLFNLKIVFFSVKIY